MLNIKNISYPAIIGILLAGLLGIAGCDLLVNTGNTNHPDWLIGSDNIPEGIAFTLDAPDEVEVGEPVPMKLTFRNTTEHDIDLFFGHSSKDGFDTPRRKNFLVADNRTDELTWSSDLLRSWDFLRKSPVITLGAGEEVIYLAEWDQTYGEFDNIHNGGEPLPKRDDAMVGAQVAPGTYILYGMLYFGVKESDSCCWDDYHTRPQSVTIIG